MSVTYFDPFAERLVTQRPYELRADLSGKARLALVANRIVDCDVFLSQVGDAINRLRPELEIVLYRTGKTSAADDAIIEEIATHCDAAICAIGHCGSCTAGTVKDSINFIGRGVPSLSLVTEHFWEQAEALARSLGWAEAPRIKLPYPIWGEGETEQRDVARRVAPQALDLLEHVHERAA